MVKSFNKLQLLNDSNLEINIRVILGLSITKIPGWCQAQFAKIRWRTLVYY